MAEPRTISDREAAERLGLSLRSLRPYLDAHGLCLKLTNRRRLTPRHCQALAAKLGEDCAGTIDSALLSAFALAMQPAAQIEPAKPPRPRRPATSQQRDRRNKWFAQRRKTHPAHRLNTNMRGAIYQSLSGTKNRRRWAELVGYSLDDLRAHLEAQFQPGMTWKNYGPVWHVDHARPLASFAITGPDCSEFRAAWALQNLQPLWAAENLRKGSRWEPQGG